MFEVRVEAGFSAAHFLRDYDGRCENLHGHNYTVLAHVRGTELDEGGMLLDFSRLKRTLRAVCSRLDHTNLNDLNDGAGRSVFLQNPSAERIARYIFDALVSGMAEQGCALAYDPAAPGRAHLFAVDVFETATSRARYCLD